MSKKQHYQQQIDGGETIASPEAKELSNLLDIIVPQLLGYVNKGSQGNHPVTTPIDPKLLYQQLDLNFNEDALDKSELQDLIEPIVQNSVHSWDPRFCDKLYAGTNPIGVISELVLAALNANGHVYHVAPALVQIEIATARALCDLFGSVDVYRGGMTFPGGSASNLTAMATARNLKFPHIKRGGYSVDDKLSIFTSAHSHYSIDKAAIESITSHATAKARWRHIHLRMSKGEKPFFVNCTYGTTVLGAYDDITAVSQIAGRFGLWLHVDGSWGGSAIFSKVHSHLLKGIHLVDSLNINPHKLLGVPLQCSFLLLKDRRLLTQANSLGAPYLFHNNVQLHEEQGELGWLTGSLDLGDSTLGCGRRLDAFMLYLTWKYYGSDSLATRIDTAFDNIRYLTSLINDHPQLQLVFPPSSVNVCFWFIPKATDVQSIDVPRFLHLAQPDLPATIYDIIPER